VVDGCFYRGFCVFHSVFGWFFVASLWWFRGETWRFDGHFFGLKKYATVLRFIFGWWWESKGNRNGNSNDKGEGDKFGRFALRASLWPSAER
jgi:hypothetical protein